jgi:hypothetical protein
VFNGDVSRNQFGPSIVDGLFGPAEVKSQSQPEAKAAGLWDPSPLMGMNAEWLTPDHPPSKVTAAQIASTRLPLRTADELMATPLP